MIRFDDNLYRMVKNYRAMYESTPLIIQTDDIEDYMGRLEESDFGAAEIISGNTFIGGDGIEYTWDMPCSDSINIQGDLYQVWRVFNEEGLTLYFIADLGEYEMHDGPFNSFEDTANYFKAGYGIEVEYKDFDDDNDYLQEDTKKLSNGKWANVGDDGKIDSGTFKTKKDADALRRAMFAHGYKG